jgi:hypothetical protein
MRGRPPKTFTHDADRYVMALAVAFWALGASRRGCCEIAVAATEGWPIGPNPKKRDKGGHGLNLLDLVYDLKTPWFLTASIAGRAGGLRRKIKKALKDPEAAAWLQEMGELFLIALRHGAERGAGADEIMRRATTLGEADFARERLLPLHTLTLTRRK